MMETICVKLWIAQVAIRCLHYQIVANNIFLANLATSMLIADS